MYISRSKCRERLMCVAWVRRLDELVLTGQGLSVITSAAWMRRYDP